MSVRPYRHCEGLRGNFCTIVFAVESAALELLSLGAGSRKHGQCQARVQALPDALAMLPPLGLMLWAPRPERESTGGAWARAAAQCTCRGAASLPGAQCHTFLARGSCH